MFGKYIKYAVVMVILVALLPAGIIIVIGGVAETSISLVTTHPVTVFLWSIWATFCILVVKPGEL